MFHRKHYFSENTAGSVAERYSPDIQCVKDDNQPQVPILNNINANVFKQIIREYTTFLRNIYYLCRQNILFFINFLNY